MKNFNNVFIKCGTSSLNQVSQSPLAINRGIKLVRHQSVHIFDMIIIRHSNNLFGKELKKMNEAQF